MYAFGNELGWEHDVFVPVVWQGFEAIIAESKATALLLFPMGLFCLFYQLCELNLLLCCVYKTCPLVGLMPGVNGTKRFPWELELMDFIFFLLQIHVTMSKMPFNVVNVDCQILIPFLSFSFAQ